MQTAQRSNKVVLGGAAAGSRDREVTVPGRLAAPDPFPPPERRTARLLVAITGGSAAAFAAIAFVGLQILLHALGGRMEDNKPECTEGTTPDGCPDGLVCMGRTCSVEPDYGPARCDVGDPCGAKGTCTCDGALECVADSCVQTASTLPADICEQTDVKDALKQLKVACAGNISNCPATNLQSFAINYSDFDTLIARFPATLTVHFPGGKPPIDKGELEWPTGVVKDFYLERIRRSAPAFREARSIFVIARSSPGGNIVRNELFAQARSRIVKDLVLDAVEYGERDTVEGKFYDFILGHKRRIDRNFFAERFKNRFITWDQKSRDRLLGLISADELSEANDAWVTQTINQVVLIVPVPCEIK